MSPLLFAGRNRAVDCWNRFGRASPLPVVAVRKISKSAMSESALIRTTITRDVYDEVRLIEEYVDSGTAAPEIRSTNNEHYRRGGPTPTVGPRWKAERDRR